MLSGVWAFSVGFWTLFERTMRWKGFSLDRDASACSALAVYPTVDVADSNLTLWSPVSGRVDDGRLDTGAISFRAARGFGERGLLLLDFIHHVLGAIVRAVGMAGTVLFVLDTARIRVWRTPSSLRDTLGSDRLDRSMCGRPSLRYVRGRCNVWPEQSGIERSIKARMLMVRILRLLQLLLQKIQIRHQPTRIRFLQEILQGIPEFPIVEILEEFRWRFSRDLDYQCCDLLLQLH